MQTQGSCKIIIQTQGSFKTHIVIIVRTQESCNKWTCSNLSIINIVCTCFAILRYAPWNRYFLIRLAHIKTNITLEGFLGFIPIIPCGSRVMSIFTNWPKPAELMLCKPSSIRKGCWHAFVCKTWSQSVMPFKKIMSISLTGNGRMNGWTDGLMDGWTHIVIVVQTKGSYNYTKIVT